MKRRPPRDEPTVDFREASQALVELLDRVESVDGLLATVCSCAREERMAGAADDKVPHLWPCTAGCVEYWFSRHIVEAANWIAAFSYTRPLPPEPTW